MNVQDGLKEIRRRLDEDQANPQTLKVVDGIMERAALPAAASASATSMLQLVRMLMRTPGANSDTAVYNDFVRLEDSLERHADEVRAVREEQEARPIPKTKKYYKDLKESEAKKRKN